MASPIRQIPRRSIQVSEAATVPRCASDSVVGLARPHPLHAVVRTVRSQSVGVVTAVACGTGEERATHDTAATSPSVSVCAGRCRSILHPF